jgi:hypothetical protein
MRRVRIPERLPNAMWTSRLVVLALGILLLGSLTIASSLPSIAGDLVCAEHVAPSDAILVETLSLDYLLFERAAALQQAGLSRRVLVLVQATGPDSQEANPVSKGIAELMARFARLRNPELIPIRAIEPYSLNAAYQIRDVLAAGNARSVLIVASGWRSRRSLLVYRAVLKPTGIRVYCLPVFGTHRPENWTASWHGIEAVGEQFLKLQYYRFYVLRGQ